MPFQQPAGNELSELFLSSIGGYTAIMERGTEHLGFPQEEAVLSVAALAIGNEDGHILHGFIGGLDSEQGNPPKRRVEAMYGATIYNLESQGGLSQLDMDDLGFIRRLFVETALRANRRIIAAYVMARSHRTGALLDTVMFPGEMRERFPGVMRDLVTERLAKGGVSYENDAEIRGIKAMAGMHDSMAALMVQNGAVTALPSRRAFKQLVRAYYDKTD